MTHRLHWFLRWLAYRFVTAWPLDWWPTMRVLPYAGEYVFGGFADFVEHRMNPGRRTALGLAQIDAFLEGR